METSPREVYDSSNSVSKERGSQSVAGPLAGEKLMSSPISHDLRPLVLVDASLPDLHRLQAALGRRGEVALIGEQGLPAALCGRPVGRIEVHLVCHGAPGRLELGGALRLDRSYTDGAAFMLELPQQVGGKRLDRLMATA